MAVNTLEELTNAALNAQGYLTIENAAYRRHANAKSLAGQDNVQNMISDIDLIAFAPKKTKATAVYAINCKGASAGLDLPRDAERVSNGSAQPVAGGSGRTGFRELCEPDWAKAFRFRVEALTGRKDFTHVTVVRKYTGKATDWTEHQPFKDMLTPKLELWDLDDVVRKLLKGKEKIHFNNNMLKLVELLYRPEPE